MARGARWAGWLALVGVFALCVGQLICLFPPSEWSSPLPILTDDYAHRFYFANVRLTFLKGHGALWGYDPFHMAGYPHSPLFPPQNDLYEFILAALPFAPALIVYKAMVLALPLIVPALAAIAVAAAGLGRRRTILAAAIGSSLFWTWIPIGMYLSGALCFVLACFLCPLVCVCLWRYVRAPAARSWLPLAVLLAATVFIHPGAVAVLAVPAAFILGSREARGGARRWLGLLALIPTTILASWIWISPCLRFRSTALAWGPEVRGIFNWSFSLFWLSGARGLPFYAACFLALAGWMLRGERDRDESVAPCEEDRCLLSGSIAGAFCLTLLSVAGYGIEIVGAMEPYRFLVGASALFVLPAVCGASALAGKRERVALLLALGIAGLGFAPFFLTAGRPSLKATLPPQGERLVEWIRKSTGPEGRLLVEDSGWELLASDWRANFVRPGHHWFGCHLPALLPLITGREIVGGPFPGHFLVHMFTGFWGGKLFGKDVGEYSEDELASYLELYNVHWVTAWSGRAKERFDRTGALLEKTGDIGEFSTYRVRDPGSFFLRGSGKAEVFWGGIRLTEITPQDGAIVISYHWWDRLVARPAARVEPEARLRDPVPFIRVANPPRELEIVTDYGEDPR